MIALSGDGSYRDALSNLQKVLSFNDQEYTEEFVAKVLGIPQVSAIFDYLKSLDGITEAKEGIMVLKKLEEHSIDTNLFAKELVYFARLLLLARHKLITPDEMKGEYGEHVLEFIKIFTENNNKDKSQKFNSAMLSKILELEISSKNSSLPMLGWVLLLFA